MDSGQLLQALKALQAEVDIETVRRAIMKMSGQSGPVRSFSVSFDKARGTVSCYLEMKSPLHDLEVRELGACGFGNGVCLECALKDPWVPPI